MEDVLQKFQMHLTFDYDGIMAINAVRCQRGIPFPMINLSQVMFGAFRQDIIIRSNVIES